MKLRTAILVIVCVALSIAAVKLGRKNPDEYYKLGNDKKGKGELDAAIAYYDQAIAANPDFADALNNRGNAKKIKGDYAGAMADFDLAIKANPGHFRAFNNQAIVRKAQGDLSGAITEFGTAIKLAPTFTLAYFNRGVAEEEAGELEAALADFRTNYDLDLNNRNSASLRIWLVRVQKGEKAAADSELSSYLQQRDKELGKQYLDWPVEIALFFLDRIDEEALHNIVNTRNPETTSVRNCEFWYYVGMKKLLMGDEQGAAAYFERCVETHDRDFIAYDSAKFELNSIKTNNASASVLK